MNDLIKEFNIKTFYYNPKENNIIDNALILFYPGPNTVTGEDVLEFHIHGSTVIEKKIYNVLFFIHINTIYFDICFFFIFIFFCTGKVF